MVLPEPALGGGGLAGLGGERRQRMALGDRQVTEGEDEPIAEPLAHPAQHRLGAEAEGALEVAEHDQLQRPAQLATDVVGLVERGSERVVHSAGCYAHMNHIESILVLMLAATLLVRLADFGKVPAPIVLVVGGLAIAFVPGLPTVELDPDVIFLVFLPPLVFSAGWRTSPRELRTVMRPLALLAVGLVFLTAAVVAAGRPRHRAGTGLGRGGRARRRPRPHRRRRRDRHLPPHRRPRAGAAAGRRRVDDQRRHRPGPLLDRPRRRHRRRLLARRRGARIRRRLARRHRHRPRRRLPLDPRHPPPGRRQPRRRPHRADRLRRLHRRRGARRLRHPRRRRRRPLRRLPGAALGRRRHPPQLDRLLERPHLRRSR